TSISMATCLLMPLVSCAQNISTRNNTINEELKITPNETVKVPLIVDNEGLESAVTTDQAFFEFNPDTSWSSGDIVLKTLDSKFVVDGIKSLKCGEQDFKDQIDINYLPDDGTTKLKIGTGLFPTIAEKHSPIIITPRVVTKRECKVVMVNPSTRCEIINPIIYRSKDDYELSITRTDFQSKYSLTDYIQIRTPNGLLVGDEYTYELSSDKKVGTLTIHGNKCYEKLTGDLQIDAGYGGVEKFDANVYMNGKRIQILRRVLPDTGEGVNSITFYAPHWINEYGKILNANGELSWEYVDSYDEPTSTVSVDPIANTITIQFESGTKHTFSGDININVTCIQKDERNSFNNDLWENLIFWTNLFEDDSDTIAKTYGFENGDALLGEKRTVMWDNKPHKVLVASTNQLHISPWSADENQWRKAKKDGDMENKWMQEVNQQPTAAFTFKFVNVLTDSSGNVVKSKFERDHSLDAGCNHWVFNETGHTEFINPEEIAYNGVSSDLRLFVRNNDQFLSKFSDKGLVENVKPVVMSHIIWNGSEADSGLYTEEAYVTDQFFIPTCEQIGAPQKEDDKGHWNFTEKYTDPFELYLKAEYEDKPDKHACDWRRCGPVGWDEQSNGEWYWTASPSKEGSGVGRTENSVNVGRDGKIWNGDMTDKNAILPCFNI
ncbi:MAG: hypothetical protein KBS35_01335, partial [Mycoplasma sp.]|nr:hypothetical protein [Candidatus Hennigella equi]